MNTACKQKKKKMTKKATAIEYGNVAGGDGPSTIKSVVMSLDQAHAELKKGFMTHKEDGTKIKKPSLYQRARGALGLPRTDITDTGDDAPKLPKAKATLKKDLDAKQTSSTPKPAPSPHRRVETPMSTVAPSKPPALAPDQMNSRTRNAVPSGSRAAMMGSEYANKNKPSISKDMTEPAKPQASSVPFNRRRAPKDTVKMKPISNAEAVANLRQGKFHEKSLRMNIAELQATLEKAKPVERLERESGRLGFNPKGHDMQARGARVNSRGSRQPPKAKKIEGEKYKQELRRKNAPLADSAFNPRRRNNPNVGTTKPKQFGRNQVQAKINAADSHKKEKEYHAEVASATARGNSWKSLNRQSSSDADINGTHTENNMSKDNTDTDLTKSLGDLFKSEVGDSDDKHLIDCPHCDHAITKSEVIAKARGKGKSGGLPGKAGSSDDTEHQNSASGKGGNARYGSAPKPHVATVKAGKKVAKTSPAYPKTMAAKKSDADDESVDEQEETEESTETVVKSSVRGTAHVQYFVDGSETGDAAIARQIAEGTLGQMPTTPIDKNHRRF